MTVTPQARAATESERREASARFKRGAELYTEGNFRAALIEFQRAHKLVPNYRVLYNIGQAHFQLQDYAAALETFEQYLQEGGDDIEAERRESVNADIERLKGRVAYVELRVDEDGAQVSVDEVRRGVSPLAGRLALSAGRRKVTVEKDGYAPVTRFVDVAGGDSRIVEVELAPVPRADGIPVETGPTEGPPPGDDAGDAESSIPWGAWAATASFTAVAVVFGALALNAAGDLDGIKERATTEDEVQGARDKLLGFSVTADILLAGAIISGAVAIYMTVDATSGDGGETRAGLRVGLGPTSAMLQGSF
jgi:hypothetical protein